MEDRKKGFEVGAVDFIAKPFQKGEILAVANKILNPPLMHKGITPWSPMITLLPENCIIMPEPEGIEVHEARTASRLTRSCVQPGQDGYRHYRPCHAEHGWNAVVQAYSAGSCQAGYSDYRFNRHVGFFRDTGSLKVGASDICQTLAKEELLARINVHIERNKVNRELRETIKLLKEAMRN